MIKHQIGFGRTYQQTWRRGHWWIRCGGTELCWCRFGAGCFWQRNNDGNGSFGVVIYCSRVVFMVVSGGGDNYKVGQELWTVISWLRLNIFGCFFMFVLKLLKLSTTWRNLNFESQSIYEVMQFAGGLKSAWKWKLGGDVVACGCVEGWFSFWFGSWYASSLSQRGEMERKLKMMMYYALCPSQFELLGSKLDDVQTKLRAKKWWAKVEHF